MIKSSSERDEVARDSLWNVLVAEMRAELTVHEAEGTVHHPRLYEPLRNELIATTSDGFISIWLHPEDGTGSWNQIAPLDECEPWSLTPEGVATLSGTQMSIAQLAKAFVLKLVPQSE